MNSDLYKDLFGDDHIIWRRILPLWRMAMDRAQPCEAITIGDQRGIFATWLALQGVNVRCTAPVMTASAMAPMPLHLKYKVQDRIQYAAASPVVSALDFDLVLSDVGSNAASLVLGIDHYVKPGGVWLFRKGAADMEGLVAALTAKGNYRLELRSWGFLMRFARNERQRALFARIDARITRFVPRRWRYVSFGTATRVC